MFRNIFALIGVYMFASLCLWAQTDVTDQYIVNADFSMNWATEEIGAYDAPKKYGVIEHSAIDAYGWITERYDVTHELTNPVNGTKRNDYFSWGGPLKYGSGYTMSASAIQVNSDGTTAGCALGISSSWLGGIAYTQEVVLPSGLYKLTFYTYNVSAKGFLYNRMGVITSDGVEHFCTDMNMASNVWETHSVEFSVESSQTVKISVGMGAQNEGAANHAKFFVDKVVLEAYNAAEPGLLMPGESVSDVQFEGYNVNGGITFGSVGAFPEKYYVTAEVPTTGETMSVSKTGLSNGVYWVDVYYQAHQANNQVAGVENGMVAAYIKSNNVEIPVSVMNENGASQYEPTLYSMRDVKVTNGTLKVEVGALQKAANWFTAKIRSVRKMTTPFVSYGAFELPTETPVTAGYWYRLDVPAGVSGDFTIYSEQPTTLFYTNDANASIDGSFLAKSLSSSGTILTLTSGTYYLKSSVSTLVYFTKKVNNVTGSYFLRSEDGRYFGTAGESGVTAHLDAWGMCIHPTVSGDTTYLKVVEANKYLSKSGSNITFSDKATYGWDLIWCNNKYLITKSGVKQYVEVNDAGDITGNTSGTSFWTAAKWTFESVDVHATKMKALRDQANLLSSSVAGMTPNSIVPFQTITSATEVKAYSSAALHSTSFYAMPGIYSVSIPAFYCGAASVDKDSYANHTNKYDCPRAYVYFGDAQVQIKCVFDEDVTSLATTERYTNVGKYYPKNQAGAKSAFINNAYKNTLWVKVDRPGNIEYGIKMVGCANGKLLLYYATEGIEIKHYYENNLGDVDKDGVVTAADVSLLSAMLMGDSVVNTRADIIMDDVVNVYDLTELVNIVSGSANYAITPVTKPTDPTSAETTETDLHFEPAAIGTRALQIRCPDAVAACQFDIDLPNGIGWGEGPTSVIGERTILSKQIASARSGYNTYRVLLYSATNAQLSAAGMATSIVSLPLTDSGLADGLYPVYVRNVMMDGGQPYLHAMHNVEKVTSYLLKGNPLVQHLPIEGRLPSYVTSAVNASTGITSVDLTLVKEIYGSTLSLQNPNALMFGDAGTVQNQVVKGVCENLVLTDGYKFATPTEFQAKTARYSRGMSTSSIWGTVCVPYALTSNEEVQYYKLQNADFANGSLIFERVASLEAGQPALYKKQIESATEVTMQSENVTVGMDGMSFVSPATWTMKGTYSVLDNQQSSGGTYLYYIASNKFWHAKNPISIPAFRGWFESSVAPPSSSSASSLRISVFDDDEETAILQLNSDGELEEMVADGIWDLSGLRRNGSPMRGVKIVNGTKVWTK